MSGPFLLLLSKIILLLRPLVLCLMILNGYRRLVGCLIYLSCTRPHLAYAVHILSQFLHAPRTDHWDVALYVFRYMKSTPGQGILLFAASPLSLPGWCDSDWASCPLTRRSLIGWVVFLRSSLFLEKLRNNILSLGHPAEAEYCSMANLTSELKWLRALLLDIGVPYYSPTRLHCDSQSALHVAQNPVFHVGTKYIEVDCHYIRDAMKDGLLVTSHVPTNEQCTDIFTKSLGVCQFHFLFSKLGISDPHAPT